MMASGAGFLPVRSGSAVMRRVVLATRLTWLSGSGIERGSISMAPGLNLLFVGGGVRRMASELAGPRVLSKRSLLVDAGRRKI